MTKAKTRLRCAIGYGRGRKIYRYYVSETLLPNGQVGNTGNLNGTRLSAERVERLILDRLACLLPTGSVTSDVFPMISRVDCHGDHLRCQIEVAALANDTLCDDVLVGRAQQVDPRAAIVGDQLQLAIDAKPALRGRTVHAAVHLLDDREKRQVLADLVRTAHRKLAQLNASPLLPDAHAHMTTPDNEWTREQIAIGLLAPDIQKALLQGTAPAGVDPDRLLARDMPLDWAEQRRVLGFSGS